MSTQIALRASSEAFARQALTLPACRVHFSRARSFRQMLKLREQLDITGPETQEALLFLANHCKDSGALEEAQSYCSRLLDFGGHEKEEAKALLRDIRSQFSSQPSN